MPKAETGFKYKVLVVDDEQQTLDLINDYLCEEDFEVTTALSGEQALEFIDGNQYNIAIVDIHMPGMEGTELLKIIKEKKPQMQVIIITGYGTIRDAVECMKLGAADFITKPIMLDYLMMTINRVMEAARLKEEAELAEYYRNLSRTDELTGLNNFRHLVATLKHEVERHLRYEHVLSLAMIDIDDFKKYNDTYGHEEGNELLKGLSHILRHNTRNCDVLARYGGEEFIIIFPETSLSEAQIVAQRICDTVNERLASSVTIGLASLPHDTSDYHDLIRIADKAMYWGKTNGKNRCVPYQADVMATCK